MNAEEELLPRTHLQLRALERWKQWTLSKKEVVAEKRLDLHSIFISLITSSLLVLLEDSPGSDESNPSQASTGKQNTWPVRTRPS